MASRERIVAAILAAGESRRMGRPKALIEHEGAPVLQLLLNRLQDPRIVTRRIVLGAHADEIRKRIKTDPGNFLVNPAWPQGQLSSLQVAVRSLDGNECGILVWPVDHFLVSHATIVALLERFLATQKLIVVPTFQGRRGHPVIFAKELYAELLTAPLNVGARAVVWAHAQDVMEVATEEESVILNLNDPETLTRALSDPAEA
jgi:molybdenum cofactor cytidylyltransferase